MNSYSPEGMLISTEKNYRYISSEKGLEEALRDGAILEAPVLLCDSEFNLHVELPSGLTGIIPKDEVIYSREGEPAKDIAILTRVGKIAAFKVLGFVKRGGRQIALLSRRAAQRECYENFISDIVPGDIIPARVTHLESFGAFVDIGCGIVSLLSIDCISVSRISHPSARLAVGDVIRTVVKSVDERGRLSVSMRELLGSWEENAAGFREGETVRGIVRSIESYGIFVELTPNLAGLAEYREDVLVGQTAAIYIKSIIPEKMKIKLIIIDVFDEPKKKLLPKYFIDTETVSHIDSWSYSPRAAKKIIESVF
ncbi:MAG: S1 RNA-binding domain-containing protein [Clostridia bacterium]|nr:S1 RNA-binding domain-containing protein [Clostridia bacterium]